MSILMDNHSHHVSHKSWNELEGDKKIDGVENSDQISELLNKIGNFVSRKSHLISMISAISIASVFSSCGGNKSVDEEVHDIIEDKQEVVDDLKDDKRDLEQDLRDINAELREVNVDLKEAQKELEEAKRLK